MIRLDGRAVALQGSLIDLRDRVWKIGDDDRSAVLLPGVGAVPGGADLYLSVRSDQVGPDGVTLLLPARLQHLTDGDVVAVSPRDGRVKVLWKAGARHNSLLLTEQCDHYCVMCSQPPKQRDDAWLFDRAEQVVRLLPPDTAQVGLTGGEPTLHPDRLLHLLELLREQLPNSQVHLLSNGRRFAEPSFVRRYAGVGHPGLMVGIPLYAPEPERHDWVVQSPRAFDATVRGLLALGGLGQRIELRVVIQAANVPVLPELAEFIARNLPFVDQVALMGLEMTGLARANSAHVWIDPADYQPALVEAAEILTTARVRTLIFNHPLCVLDPRLHHLAVASISDWKAEYVEPCQACSAIGTCGGVFATSGTRISRHLQPL